MRGDVVVNKIAALERCLCRIRALVQKDACSLDDLTTEEAVILNVQRAREQAIGLAMHVAAARRLGVPQESREAFDLLRAAGIIDADIADRMKRMVGFRNIAVHEYQRLERAILKAIVTDHLDDFTRFAAAVVRA